MVKSSMVLARFAPGLFKAIYMVWIALAGGQIPAMAGQRHFAPL